MTKDMVRLGVTLLVLCGLAGLGLAAVYDKTKPIIDERARQDALDAAREAIPGADQVVEQVKDGVAYYLGTSAGQTVGAAMRLESYGYNKGTPIEMVVGLNAQGKVTGVRITSISETPGIGSKVNDPSFLQRFVGADPGEVDAISGATFSSRAVASGVEKAIEFLGPVVAPETAEAEIDFSSVADGTYRGTGEGLLGPIEVEVKVEGGRVASVTILSQQETAGVADPALRQVPKSIVEKQTVKVDAVAGATFTSKGIIGAVKDALGGAPTK